MAKKKSKKNVPKQAEVTSTPGSPKQAPTPVVEEEDVPDIAGSDPPVPEAQAAESSPGEQLDAATGATMPKVDTAIEGPTSEPSTTELTADGIPTSEEQTLPSTSPEKDEAATEEVAGSAAEVEVPTLEDAVSLSHDPTSLGEDAATEDVITQIDDIGSKPIEADVSASKPQEASEPAPKSETEAVSAQNDEASAKPSVVIDESAVAETDSATEQLGAEESKIAHINGINGHVEATGDHPSELSSVAAEPLEEPRSTIETAVEPPNKTEEQGLDKHITADFQESAADDEWAPISKKGKKAKKDKKKKQTATSGPVSEAVEQPTATSLPEAELTDKQLEKEQQGKSDVLCIDSRQSTDF